MANGFGGFQWRKRFIYFGRHCGIHGMNHLFQKDAIFIARLFWLFIIVASAFCLYLLLVPVIEMDGGIQFTSDTLYLNWTTTFPGITVCEELRPKSVTKKLENLYPDLMQPLSYDQKRYIVELLHGRGKYSPTRCFPCGQLIGCDVPWRKIVNDAHKKCEDLLTDCSYMGKEFSCCKIFLMVDSEYGPCFSFNTLQNARAVKELLHSSNRTVGPGELTFRLLNDATVTYYLLFFQLSIHSTEELSTNNLEADFKLIIPISQTAEILFSVQEMVNDRLVETLDIAERECRFPHEIPKDMFYTYPVYSYGACKLAKSTEHAYEHCKCVAPYRDLSYEKYYCNYTGMSCLTKHEADMKLGLEKTVEDEFCLPSCVESEIFIVNDHRTKLTTPEELINSGKINIKMSSLPTLRYRRDLTRTNLDFVVSVGGMAGLFFSASVLSFVEIFYLLLRKPGK